MIVSALIWLEMLEWVNNSSWLNARLWLASLMMCSDQGQSPWTPQPLRLPDRLFGKQRCRMLCHLVATATWRSAFPVKRRITDPYPASKRVLRGLSEMSVAPFFVCMCVLFCVTPSLFVFFILLLFCISHKLAYIDERPHPVTVVLLNATQFCLLFSLWECVCCHRLLSALHTRQHRPFVASM